MKQKLSASSLAFIAPEDLVFPSLSGHYCDDREIRDAFYAALMAAGRGLREKENPFWFYDPRHTFGTIAVRPGRFPRRSSTWATPTLPTRMMYIHYQPRHEAAQEFPEFASLADSGGWGTGHALPPTRQNAARAMTDFLSKETRSRVMSRIRSKDTKPECSLRSALFAAGLRGWRCHPKSVPGKPDVAFIRWRVAVFVDGRFWHGHPDYFTFGKSGTYWDAKIARTQERDRLANEALMAENWSVLRFWDFDVEQNLEGCVAEVAATLETAKIVTSEAA